MRKGKKTELIKVRLSSTEYEMFSEKSKSYQSMSGMIRDAVTKHNAISSKSKMEALAEMTHLYRKFIRDLALLGGNFNQLTRHANELAMSDMLTQTYFEQYILPEVTKINLLLKHIRRETDNVARKIVR
ncbi:MAG: hypothetical protein SPF56_10380 [Bacteroidaceae bacterium]|nr:hypothetical protein [Prevotellaceae bacterium]MDY5632873.1 hypothetical protein [Bacteroidaceae bacterium]